MTKNPALEVLLERLTVLDGRLDSLEKILVRQDEVLRQIRAGIEESKDYERKTTEAMDGLQLALEALSGSTG